MYEFSHFIFLLLSFCYKYIITIINMLLSPLFNIMACSVYSIMYILVPGFYTIQNNLMFNKVNTYVTPCTALH